MAVIKELLRVEDDGTLSFGDYSLKQKTKLDEFEFRGDIYKIKTFDELTKLEKNGMFVYESVPGSTVLNLMIADQEISFMVSAPADIQFTLGLEPECRYKVCIDGEDAGDMSTNLSGKLSVSAECSEDKTVEIRVIRL